MLVRRLPYQRTADLSVRRGRRCDRALRADHRQLRRRLLPLSRRLWRSRRDPRAALTACSRSASTRRIRCFPIDNRVFRGSELLREYFIFPRKFLGFKLTRAARGHAAAAQQIGRYHIRVRRAQFAPSGRCASRNRSASIRRRRSTCSRKRPTGSRSNPTPMNITSFPDRSRYLEYEPHRVLDVFAHFPARKGQGAGAPALFGLRGSDGRLRRAGFTYTVRRLPRRRTVEEKAHGTTSDYTGTDMFISLLEPGELSGQSSAVELSVRALVLQPASHRTSAGRSGRRGFPLLDDTSLELVCVAGPTRPREPVVSQMRSRSEIASVGVVTWRLINMLSLNYLGLVERGAGKNAGALREMLSLFADFVDDATERKIRGVRSVDSRPVVRRDSRARRQRSGARPGDHRHARREGVRRQRRLSARRGAGALLRRLCRLQPLHPDRRFHARSAARSCDGRRAWGRGGRCETDRPDEGRALAVRFLSRACASSSAPIPTARGSVTARRGARSMSISAKTPIWNFPASNLASVDRARGPAEDHRQVSRPAGAAGRVAAGDDGRKPRLAADARRCIPALSRPVQRPLPAAVLPGLVRCAPDRAA